MKPTEYNPECPMEGDIKMTKIYVMQQLMRLFVDNWDQNSQEIIAAKLLDTMLEMFSVRDIAEMITTFPNAGYNVRYDSEASKKFIEELHQKRIECNEKEIFKLLENGKNSRSS